MNVFGIGLPEIAVIAALALLVFGPKRLPELGRTLGKTLKGFQSASTEFEREIQKAMAEPETSDEQKALGSPNPKNSLKNNQQQQTDQTPPVS